VHDVAVPSVPCPLEFVESNLWNPLPACPSKGLINVFLQATCDMATRIVQPFGPDDSCTLHGERANAYCICELAGVGTLSVCTQYVDPWEHYVDTCVVNA
jgi:hypothetical protein